MTSHHRNANPTTMVGQPSLSLFEAVTNKDYDTISDLYAENARRTIVSFLAMRNRWSPFVGLDKSEEKCNEFLQQIACQESKLGSYNMSSAAATVTDRRSPPPVHSLGADDIQYHSILNDLSIFLTETNLNSRGEEDDDDEFGDDDDVKPPARKTTTTMSSLGDDMMDCDDLPLKQQQQQRGRNHFFRSATSVAAFPTYVPTHGAAASATTSGIACFNPHAATSTAASSGIAEASEGVNRLLWDSAAIYSDSRPPSNFVVYNGNHSGSSSNNNSAGRDEGGPPLFDGSVANSTPPPLGGISAGPSGGSGTILHLACALDSPMALAFLLAMGADARSTHTAFRRLMIHEAACNGSIQCLTLLLELGRSCARSDHHDDHHHQLEEGDSKMPHHRSNHNNNKMLLPEEARHAPSNELRFFPSGGAVAGGYHRRRPSPAEVRSRGFFGGATSSNVAASATPTTPSVPSPTEKPKGDFVQFLRLFRDYTVLVRNGFMSELDAARSILSHARLAEPSRVSLAHSCTFQKGALALSRGIFRPRGGGCADGHGNTPLHWAAFKNEVECVSLLLKYNADPNARAHPSGWTPLHDAAYSNSKESIALLVGSGAQVDARANSGATPLCFAAQEDAADAALLLLERGADLATRCAGGPYLRGDDDNGNNNHHHHHPHSRFSGYTPLHYCAHYNAHNAARVLLAHRASKRAMEISDLSERLPIHVAVARGSSDVLRELLHAGARVETPQSRQQRAQSFAQRRSESLQSTDSEATAPPTPRPRQQQPPAAAAAASAVLSTPTRGGSPNSSSTEGSSTPVSSPVLRAMIPAQPITSSKPWNCLSQRSIDECRELISHAERNWTPERHLLFTPADRRAVMELLRVGKRLEQKGSGIFIDLWPLVLSFCGRGWFEVEDEADNEDKDTDIPMCTVTRMDYQRSSPEHHLMLPSLSR